MFDPAKVREEAEWLLAHPHFEERPASITEFLGEGYLNIESLVRPGLKEALVAIFGEKVNPDRIANFERAMVTGGIGIGKTTFASIALPYMAHWVLCMKNPQGFFGLLPGSRIAFMQMSTSEKQALEVVFGDIKARIESSPWFVNNYPYDDKFTKQIRFPKDIWILPGDSAETTFEGYNILAGILDEMDSHKVTDNKDYADTGFDTIESRIASRFTDLGVGGEEMGHKGLIICIGQMKKSTGFAMRKYRQLMKDKKAYVKRMTIWESLGWEKFTRPDGTRASFWYDRKRKQIVPAGVADLIGHDAENLIEVPNAYRDQFENNPEKALKDLAGIPPEVESSFISMVDKIESCRDRWVERTKRTSPVKPDPNRVVFEDWFKQSDPRKRVVHIDFATSEDALGMAMGYVHALVKRGEEEKPYIVIDALMRIKARPGQQIILQDVRNVIYSLKADYGFKIVTVTTDGFQSTDTQQQLRKRKFFVEALSMDKSTLPYEDLREAIYEERIEFPPYMTYLRNGDTEQVEIAIRELSQLQDMGKKIDHPPDGSKDVADAIAGVATTLMGDRTYSRGIRSIGAKSEAQDNQLQNQVETPSFYLPAPGLPEGLKAPSSYTSGGFGIAIPARLRPHQER